MLNQHHRAPTHIFIVPPNVFAVEFVASGGGAAGNLADVRNKIGGAGGSAGQTIKKRLAVRPGQRFELFVGCGGYYVTQSEHQMLTSLQLEQAVYERHEAQDTIIIDCQDKNTFVARGGKGFSGGKSLPRELHAQSGIASLHNAGSGFCNAEGRWIGQGGGGGGGRYGGAGGSVFSNCKMTKAGNADVNTGCGGGGSAVVENDPHAKYHLPGNGADGYCNVICYI
jgi:hypothetical protein